MDFGVITFGVISFRTSVDGEITADIFNALEDFEWADERDVWERLRQSRDFPHCAVKDSVTVPLARPLMPTLHSFRNGPHVEYKRAPLKVISERVSPHIVRGWIEVTAMGSTPIFNGVYFESLRVYADGQIEFRDFCYEDFDPTHTLEQYSPPSAPATPKPVDKGTAIGVSN